MAISTRRRRLVQSLIAISGAAALNVRAQPETAQWPTKAIRLIVPFNAGGATDIIARTIAEALAKRMDQPVVVENQPGASGIIGTNAVAKSRADGYTLLLSLSTSMLINQFLYEKLPYSPQKDLLMLSQIAIAPVTLVAHPSLPVDDMNALLAYSKANKGKLTYGSWGVGSYAHLAGAYMSKSMDAGMVHVAYKGESPMLQDLIGGQIQMCFASALNTKPFIDAGRIKILGVTGTARMEILPAVATIKEQGVADEAYSIAGWVAMAAPTDTPRKIIDKLQSHLAEIAKDPVIRQKILAAGFEPLINTPEAFRNNYERDMPIWKSLVEQSGAKLG
ncbi:tripartite-type tricarboxylate transporter receptor subunit TctC [Advenella incenata]|uniref:Tripartite-type tricarboxylate transporter receptor subunit TctC n=1 Tax=Advenella incenata TaxID=267800 RepID=A0A4Q7VUB9_9BURK|nr:tripartite tricarboxylate transporter substrate binding protein [Advenella incenata]RZT99868.1 tripartite-type tricarboxylate transporter receptor subunit TctC [Advenella incenata]